MSSPYEHISTTDLIIELVSRNIDYRFYKTIYDNHLKEMLKDYEDRQKQRAIRFLK
jgi:hypothetical protein